MNDEETNERTHMLEINEFKIEDRERKKEKKNIPEEEEIGIDEYQKMCVFFERERERMGGDKEGRIRHFVFNPERREKEREQVDNETFRFVDH